jgi:SAM-dependent methyltransferase
MSVSRPPHSTDQILSVREIDPEGESTLEVMSAAPQFNRWMFETIRPYCVGPVLEVGSGIGNISTFLLQSGHEAHLSDLRPHYCRRLRTQFGQHSNCRGVYEMDLVHPEFDRAYGHVLGRFGTVFALNVLEHIADDHQAIANCHKLLRPSGRLIILVPAYSFLYNRFDHQLGHCRRYTRGSLGSVFTASGLDIVDTFYFNCAGIPGWFVSGTLLRKQQLSRTQLAVYNRLTWLFRLLDRLTARKLGLSVIAIGQAREPATMPTAA